MTLIKSVSGIRGTIGGKPGEGLTPPDIVTITSAYAQLIGEGRSKTKIVIGRDGRISGPMVQNLVMQTLVACGVDVIDLGLSTTPTVEVMVTHFNAQGGIILTASHNPEHWNALKLLNEKGEFISAADGQRLIELSDGAAFEYATVDQLGTVKEVNDAIDVHIQKILDLPLVDAERIRAKAYHVVLDAVNSTGAISVPPLLDALGCTCTVINGEVTGRFAHNPEPLPKHLQDLSKAVVDAGAHIGIAVDPDVDRLVFVGENGEMFGEEYTLVAISDYILAHVKGSAVSNMSSSRALRDVCEKHDVSYSSSKVGEVHVVEEMKRTSAVIGGEGNGGIIYPPLHYGRDALVGIALFLSHLAQEDKKVSVLRSDYPDYEMIKDKMPVKKKMNFRELIPHLSEAFDGYTLDDRDGIKLDFPSAWVQLRASNTEPIVRIYAEALTSSEARTLVDRVKEIIASALE